MCPLIARFPENYRHLAPAEPGSVIDGLVTLMDLGPSALVLAGLDPPAYMHGRPLFARPARDPEYRDYVFGMRDRPRHPVRDGPHCPADQRYRYQRNFYPHLPVQALRGFRVRGLWWFRSGST